MDEKIHNGILNSKAQTKFKLSVHLAYLVARSILSPISNSSEDTINFVRDYIALIFYSLVLTNLA